jgi:signal transduction histidine kinase
LHAGSLAGALAALVGLAVTRRARGPVGNLIVDLGHAGPGEVRDALARAIGDPSLELALWLPGRKAWVDEAGRDVEFPTGPDRAVTFVGTDLAAIVHDPVFLDQPAMLEAAGSAARFALENERLQAELQVQLAELRESRARIVRAGDEERRRLERDLHDGAQQRLLAVGMALQLLRTSETGEVSAKLLDETEAEVQAALADLRELARGIHPAVLTDHGLDAAVRTLAERAPIPVEIGATDKRLSGRWKLPSTSSSRRRWPTSPSTPAPRRRGSGSSSGTVPFASRWATTAPGAQPSTAAPVFAVSPTGPVHSTAG